MKTSDMLQRGLFHAIGGLSIAIAALFLPRIIFLIALGLTTFVSLAFELTRLRVAVINGWFTSFLMPLLKERESRRLTGATYLLLAALIAFLVFHRDIAVLAVSFLAVGDPLAAIVGRRLKKWPLLGRTLAGDLACFLSSIVVGLVFRSTGLNISLPIIAAGAVSAAVVAGIPLPVDDNLTMPLLAGLVMTILTI